MENRPVIILGTGLWGNLLAYRLSQQHPNVEFKLYSTGSLMESNSWSFRENELSKESLKWIKPFISYSWDCHRIVSKGIDRIMKSAYSTILPGQFELLTRKSHAAERLGPDVTMDDLLDEASFIIDTRPDPRQKTKCYRQTFGVVVELFEKHDLDVPVSMDASVRQLDVLRHLQYISINNHTLLVKDVRYSKDPAFDVPTREEELLREIRKKWRVKEVLHIETESITIPSGRIRPWNNGKVISLAGLLNPITGEQFTEAVRLVDIMVGTSFRLGELKEVIQRYRNEKDQSKRISRLLAKLIYHTPEHAHRLQLLDYLFKLPAATVEKFMDGKLGMFDVGRIMMAKPPLPLLRALGSAMPDFRFKAPNKSTKLRELTH
ncbi:MAG TPA: lycopene cyclase family protein [Bacteriovoracaceae bacterium]|nr:lycopene cyclase family protein [Bacteriovoracaceae bacterium]